MSPLLPRRVSVAASSAMVVAKPIISSSELDHDRAAHPVRSILVLVVNRCRCRQTGRIRERNVNGM